MKLASEPPATAMSERTKSVDGLLSANVMVDVSPRFRDDLLLVITTVGPCAAIEVTTRAALRRPPLAVLPASDATGSTLSMSLRFSWVTESDGSTATASAATPATCGEAMLVPLRVPYRLPGMVL